MAWGFAGHEQQLFPTTGDSETHNLDYGNWHIAKKQRGIIEPQLTPEEWHTTSQNSRDPFLPVPLLARQTDMGEPCPRDSTQERGRWEGRGAARPDARASEPGRNTRILLPNFCRRIGGGALEVLINTPSPREPVMWASRITSSRGH